MAVLRSGVGGAYTVKPGDTLHSLAPTYRTTVAALVRPIGLSSASPVRHTLMARVLVIVL